LAGSLIEGVSAHRRIRLGDFVAARRIFFPGVAMADSVLATARARFRERTTR
jgi:hypothetical protein